MSHEAAQGDAGGDRVIVDIPVVQGHGPSANAGARAPAASEEDDKSDLLAKRKWITDMRGWLMVLATLAASLSYRASLRHNFAKNSHGYFSAFNGMALVTSLLIMVLVSSERFYRTRARMTALLLVTIFDLACLVSAFACGTSPEDPLGGSFYLVAAVVVCIVVVFSVVYIGKAIWKLVHRLAKLWWCPDEATKQAASGKRPCCGQQ